MKFKKYSRTLLLIGLVVFLMGFPQKTAVKAYPVLEPEQHIEIQNIPVKTEIQMIATKDTIVSNFETNTNVLMFGGSIVVFDRHSATNEKIIIEYQDEIYYAKGNDFKIVIGTDEKIHQISLQLAEESQSLRTNQTHDQEMARLNSLYSEYPVTNYVYDNLRNHGYSEVIAAAIIGNMMVECGGYTFTLQPYIWGGGGNNFYGLCQWYNKYNTSIMNGSIDQQLEYLYNSIESEFRTFGRLSGYTYEEFLNITNERVAAEAFAATYERCGSGSYGLRRDCATKALEYFGTR